MSNPFKVLGLTPDIIRQLGDEGTLEAAKRNYRALSLVVHPDAGGTDAEFKKLDSAYRALSEDPVAFQSYKTDYLKKRKDRLEELSGDLDDTVVRLSQVTEQLQEYVALAVKSGGIRLPGALLVNDSLKKVIVEKSNRFLTERDRGLLEQQSAYTLQLNGGKWSKTALKFSRKCQVDNLVLGYHRTESGWMLVSGNGESRSAVCWNEAVKANSLDCVLVGTVSLEVDGNDSRGLTEALAIEGNREDFNRASHGYDWNSFRYLLPTLTTAVTLGSYLVGAKLVEGGIRFFLLGKVVAIDHL